MRDARMERVMLRRPDLRTRFPAVCRAARGPHRACRGAPREVSPRAGVIRRDADHAPRYVRVVPCRHEPFRRAIPHERDRHDHVDVRSLERRDGGVQRSAAVRLHGSGRRRRLPTYPASAGSVRSRCRRSSTRSRWRAPAPERRRRSRRRSWISASWPAWATSTSARRCTLPGCRPAAGVDDRHANGRAARRGVSAGGCHQVGARAGHRARLERPVSGRQVPGLRPRGCALPAPRLPRCRQASHAGGTFDFLLPRMSALEGRSLKNATKQLPTSNLQLPNQAPYWALGVGRWER